MSDKQALHDTLYIGTDTYKAALDFADDNQGLISHEAAYYFYLGYHARDEVMAKMSDFPGPDKQNEGWGVQDAEHVDSAFSAMKVTAYSRDCYRWQHPAHNAKLHITKNGVTVTLDEEEIRAVVSAAGANFRR